MPPTHFDLGKVHFC